MRGDERVREPGALMRCPQPGGVTLSNSVALNHSVRDAGRFVPVQLRAGLRGRRTVSHGLLLQSLLRTLLQL